VHLLCLYNCCQFLTVLAVAVLICRKWLLQQTACSEHVFPGVWQILASCNVCLFLPLHLSVGTNSHLSTRILIGTKRRQKQGSAEGLYNQQQWGKGNRKAPVSSCLSAALYLSPTDHTWPQPSSSFLDPKEEEWTRAFLVPLGSDLLCNFLLSTRQNSFPCFPMKEHGSVSSFSQEKC